MKNNDKCDLLWNKWYDPSEKYLRFTNANTPHYFFKYISSLLHVLQSGENVTYINQLELVVSYFTTFLENILAKEEAIRLSAVSKSLYR